MLGKRLYGWHIILEELVKKQSEKIIYSDSQSAIQLVKKSSLSFEDHITRRYHFTRRAVEDGDMFLEKIEGAKNPIVLMLGN